MEQNLLAAAIKSREAFQRVVGLGADSLSDKGGIILEEIGHYYAKDPHALCADANLVAEALERKHPRQAEVFGIAVRNLPVDDVSPANVLANIIEAKLDDLQQKLAQAFARGDAEKAGELLPLWRDLRDGCIEEQEEGAEVLINPSIAELFADKKKEKIKVAPKIVNDYLDGGPSRGEHIVVFGRPEIAKTTFMINMIHGFAYQKLKVLYMNNEDPSTKIMLRYFTRTLGLTKHELEKDLPGADVKMKELGLLENIIFFNVPDGTLNELENLIVTHRPDVVIVDQMRNINCKGENRVLQLEHVARALRKFAKKHDLLMVSVTQAGDSAENKAVLEMGDVDWNNTGIQGAADVMIGIGATEQMKETGQRVLSFPKNKVSGRHDAIQVQFDTVGARVK